MVPLLTFKEKYFWHHLLQYLKKVTLLGLWACDTFLAFKLGQYSVLIPVFYILFIVLNFYKITKICFRDFFNLSSYFFLSKIFKWRSLEPFNQFGIIDFHGTVNYTIVKRMTDEYHSLVFLI